MIFTQVAADFSNDTWWISAIKALVLVLFLIFSVIFALWLERRLIARFQNRLGPNTVGPFGLGQSFPDALKLIFKEDFWLEGADKIVYIVAPCLTAICAFSVIAVVPLGPTVSVFGVHTPLQLTDSPVALLFVLAVAALGEYGMVFGGWSAKSTLPLYGSVRSATQMISYELAQGLSLVTVFLTAATMSTSGIVAGQQNLWNVVTLMPAFLIFLVTMFGETNRLPFDLPEAEGEIVAGPHTEYSSMKFAWYYLGEYVNMFNVSMLAVTLFFGGWRSGPVVTYLAGLASFNPNAGWFPMFIFAAKIWTFIAIFIWVRATLLRFRYDQFMKLGWKGLIPCALIWLAIVLVVHGYKMINPAFNDRGPMIILSIGFSAIMLVWAFVRDDETPTQEEIIAQRESEEFDGFEDGYPVPPLPGQHLPPSPRAARKVASTVPSHNEEA